MTGSIKTESALEAEQAMRLGVSSCLLGQAVRYDGGHKRDAFVMDTLAEYFRFVPVCPEVEMGMSTPREALRLVHSKSGNRMVGRKTGTDHTAAMNRYAKRRVAALRKLDLHGYVLKKGSPSCGMERVRTYTEKGMPLGSDSGLFAAALMDAMPLLPIEEEGRLKDPALRENFIVRVFAYHRLESVFSGRWKHSDLVAFQAAEKLLLMAHAPAAQKELGRIVADAKALGRAATREAYKAGFMKALAKPAKRARHTNALQHMLGYFKKLLTPAEKSEVVAVIEDFHKGLVPLIVPITLVRHFVRIHEVLYLANQTYLDPHPKELALRNHA
jgi:uncharacterized protein YbbK (DUF523 family)/uncharacterized protein YbgA (DUF1722 family)